MEGGKIVDENLPVGMVKSLRKNHQSRALKRKIESRGQELDMG